MSAEIVLSYLKAMDQHNASDLYLTVGHVPAVRAEDEMIDIAQEKLSLEDVNEILNAMLTTRQKRDFERTMELNSALDMGEHGRFRISVLRQRQNPAVVVRRIKSKIPDFTTLNLPPVLEALSMEKRGLVLVSGMTGSGKTTTVSAMIDHRNQNRSGHIITIEDPIEFYHEHKQSVVTQREVGVDTESFPVALKNALRQRPDVIVVGEIRDREVMEQALSIAETGHLCLATIHTSNAYQAIERIVNMFSEDQHEQIRLNLSLNLKAIVSQRLMPSVEGALVPAVEVMLNQGLIRELILKGEISKMEQIMEQSNSLGMCSFDQSMMALYLEGKISEETLVNQAEKPSDMKVKIQEVKMAGKTGDVRHMLQAFDTSLISLKD